ncbi:hypothetical protein RQP46_011490 [Phenoliferia psychrophenolica]
MVFTLIVKLELLNEEGIPTMKTKLVEYAESYRKDQGTLAWHVHQDKKEPKKFMIMERYESPTSIAIHKANPSFATFAPFLEEIKLAQPYELGMYDEL